jgi:hypothetical protein
MTGLIAVSDRYDRKATLAAGRVWQRQHLSATARGLAMQPLNQPIEMIDRERQSGRGAQWAKRVASPDRRRVASHVLVSRRLRVASGAAEPEAQAQGCRAGVRRPMLGPIWPAGFVPGSVNGVDGGIRRG